MNPAEKFLDIYNQVDKLLKDYDETNYETFSRRVKKSHKPIIERFKKKLLDFGDLRNAIVHTPKEDGKYIAMPLETTVKEFEAVLEKIRNPKRVIPEFQRKVEGAEKTTKLSELLEIINKNNFSQIPIIEDGRVIEIISTNTVARWLSNQWDEDGCIMKEDPVIDSLFEHIEFENNYKFISRNTDVYEAQSIFTEYIKKHNRNLDAIFITQNGKSSEKLLGIITIEDIADFFDF